jgi:hypothetical protein
MNTFIGYPFTKGKDNDHRLIAALTFIASEVSLEDGSYDHKTGLGTDASFRRETYILPQEKSSFVNQLESELYHRLRLKLRPDFTRHFKDDPSKFDQQALLVWDPNENVGLDAICNAIEQFWAKRNWDIYWHQAVKVGFAGPFLALILFNNQVNTEQTYLSLFDGLRPGLNKMRDDAIFISTPYPVIVSYPVVEKQQVIRSGPVQEPLPMWGELADEEEARLKEEKEKKAQKKQEEVTLEKVVVVEGDTQ